MRPADGLGCGSVEGDVVKLIVVIGVLLIGSLVIWTGGFGLLGHIVIEQSKHDRDPELPDISLGTAWKFALIMVLAALVFTSVCLLYSFGSDW